MSFKARFPLSLDIDERLTFAGMRAPQTVLNLGAGINPILGAMNVDNYPAPDIQIVADLRDSLPFGDAQFDCVCGFHVIEHLAVEKAFQLVQEAGRVLKPGGVLILECPDIKGLAQEIVDGNYGAVRLAYGCQRADGDTHLWGYTADSLAMLAVLAGFSQFVTKKGTDYHSFQMPTIRLEAAWTEVRSR